MCIYLRLCFQTTNGNIHFIFIVADTKMQNLSNFYKNRGQCSQVYAEFLEKKHFWPTLNINIMIPKLQNGWRSSLWAMRGTKSHTNKQRMVFKLDVYYIKQLGENFIEKVFQKQLWEQHAFRFARSFVHLHTYSNIIYYTCLRAHTYTKSKLKMKITETISLWMFPITVKAYNENLQIVEQFITNSLPLLSYSCLFNETMILHTSWICKLRFSLFHFRLHILSLLANIFFVVVDVKVSTRYKNRI